MSGAGSGIPTAAPRNGTILDPVGEQVAQVVFGVNCSLHSATIQPGDTCPGLCYTSFKDDSKALMGLLCIGTMLIYNTVYFFSKRKREGFYAKVAEQWAAVIVQGRTSDTKQPVTAIQTMRCALQASQAFSAVAGAIAAYGLMVEEEDRHNRILFMYLAIVNWVAVFFFCEQMRYLYHIAYLCVRSTPLSREQIPTEFLDYLAEVIRTDDTSEEPKEHDEKQLQKYMNDDRIAPFVEGVSRTAYRMNLETFLPPELEMERIALFLQRSFDFFSLGQRAFLAGLPIMFGFLHDYYMIIATILLLTFHLVYYDNLLDHIGGSWEAAACFSLFRRWSERREEKAEEATAAAGGETTLEPGMADRQDSLNSLATPTTSGSPTQKQGSRQAGKSRAAAGGGGGADITAAMSDSDQGTPLASAIGKESPPPVEY